jgi:hypothetical protein
MCLPKDTAGLGAIIVGHVPLWYSGAAGGREKRVIVAQIVWLAAMFGGHCSSRGGWVGGEVVVSRGDFECAGEENGLPVYHICWNGEPADDLGEAEPAEAELSEKERRYALFVRYLIQQGRLGR